MEECDIVKELDFLVSIPFWQLRISSGELLIELLRKSEIARLYRSDSVDVDALHLVRDRRENFRFAMLALVFEIEIYFEQIVVEFRALLGQLDRQLLDRLFYCSIERVSTGNISFVRELADLADVHICFMHDRLELERRCLDGGK